MAKVGTWESRGNRHIDVQGSRRPMPYHEVISELALKHSRDNDRILDIGCGIGSISRLIHSGGPRRISIADAYEVCLNTTGETTPVENAFLLDETRFDVVEKIRETFDVVVMSHVLEHLLNPVQAVRDTMTLVRPGGHLILAVPNPGRPDVVVNNLFKVHYVNRGHVVSWDASHWRNFLECVLELDVIEYAHDFIRIKGCNRFSPLLGVGKLLGHLAPWWCFSNIAVIRRET